MQSHEMAQIMEASQKLTNMSYLKILHWLGYGMVSNEGNMLS